VTTDCNGRYIIYPNIFTYPTVIANGQHPWVLDINTRFDSTALSNLSAVNLEQRDF
jgi:hypothetical protein